MLLGRKKVVWSRHILTLDIRDIQNGQLSAAGVPVFIFFFHSTFLASSTGTFAASASGVVRFCWQFFHRLPYYPFDFAFFAQKTPRRFPGQALVEISTAPTRQKLSVAAILMNLFMTGTTETHEV